MQPGTLAEQRSAKAGWQAVAELLTTIFLEQGQDHAPACHQRLSAHATSLSALALRRRGSQMSACRSSARGFAALPPALSASCLRTTSHSAPLLQNDAPRQIMHRHPDCKMAVKGSKQHQYLYVQVTVLEAIPSPQIWPFTYILCNRITRCSWLSHISCTYTVKVDKECLVFCTARSQTQQLEEVIYLRMCACAAWSQHPGYAEAAQA